MRLLKAAAALAVILVLAPLGISQGTQGLQSETPKNFEAANGSFDFTRHVVMTPMRDGVRLNTVILVPEGARNAPILLMRAPYDANALTSHAASSHLGSGLQG